MAKTTCSRIKVSAGTVLARPPLFKRPLWLTLTCIGCALLFLAPAASAQTPTPTPAAGKRLALLIGVNKYDKRGFRDLAFAERDVEELAKILEPAGYEVQLLTGTASGAKRGTLENIQKAADALLTRRTKHDLIMVALAGHGLQIEVAGPDGKLQSESFFCPVDAETGNPETMLAMGGLFQQINLKGGGSNLVLVDACREDPTRGRGMDGSTVKTLPEGVAVLFGCRAGQKTFETKDAGGGHGVFFHLVLEGMRGGAKTSRGEVTWNSLVDYVTEHVPEAAPKLLGDAAVEQTPNLIANLPGRTPVILRGGDETPADAFKALRQAALDRDAWAAFFLGWAVNFDPDRINLQFVTDLPPGAQQHYKRFRLARSAEIVPDCAEAAKWFRIAAERGHLGACCELGYCLGAGCGVPRNDEEALRWVRKAAEGGAAYSMLQMAEIYGGGYGVPIDEAEAARWVATLRKGAESGSDSAALNLALCYRDGLGVKRNPATAATWFEKSKERYARSGLACLYRDGQGVARDLKKATTLFRQLVKGGDDGSCHELATLFEQFPEQVGDEDGGPSLLDSRYRDYCQKGARAGDAWAMNQLGYTLEFGKGGTANAAEAAKWYQKAAELGNAQAMWSLAFCYRDGKGVKESRDLHAHWSRRAIVTDFGIELSNAAAVDGATLHYYFGDSSDKLASGESCWHLSRCKQPVWYWNAERWVEVPLRDSALIVFTVRSGRWVHEVRSVTP